MRAEIADRVQTVLGMVDADFLGVTLPHEHLLLDSSCWFEEPSEAAERVLVHQPISLRNVNWVNRHPCNNMDNLQMFDEQVATDEALLFKKAGGGTIVDLTNIGLGRTPLALVRIARLTGLNIIMGAGYYLQSSHPPKLATMTDEEIADEIVRDITVGIDETGVRAGIIGEIGCSTPLTENERKVLRGSASAQKRTGSAINIHNDCEKQALEIIRILADAGADLSHVILSHVDDWGDNPTILPKLIEAGCYLSFDWFGHEVGCLPTNLEPNYVLSDAQRISSIIRLIAQGYLDRILISHDVGEKRLFTKWGGFGYAHILRHVVPLMRQKSISEEVIHTILVENPKRVLRFSKVTT